MGSSPQYFGSVALSPPLQPSDVAAINAALAMENEDNQSRLLPEVSDSPTRALVPLTIAVPTGPPSKFCGWRLSDGGASVVWDGEEKFHHAEHWMAWLVSQLPAGVHCSGRIIAIGENIDWFDAWRIDVVDSTVTATRYSVPWFDGARWAELSNGDPYVPELVHQALLDVQYGIGTGEGHLRVFFAALRANERPLKSSLTTLLGDLVEIAAAPTSWRSLLAELGNNGGRHLRSI